MEITHLTENIRNDEDDDLGEQVLMVFEKLEVTVDSSNVAYCHRLLNNLNKKFIIKLSKCKDAKKFQG